jgi:hypothetical protein
MHCSLFLSLSVSLCQKSWILIITATGFLIGFLRWATKYPDNLPGFFKEVNDCHVDPTWALHTVLFSALSIAGGANSGPEQAMVSPALLSPGRPDLFKGQSRRRPRHTSRTQT